MVKFDSITVNGIELREYFEYLILYSTFEVYHET